MLMHAERDAVMANLLVRHTLVLHLCKRTHFVELLPLGLSGMDMTRVLVVVFLYFIKIKVEPLSGH